MLAVYPWAFSYCYIGRPEPQRQIRVNEAHFFICVYLGNCRLWAYGKEKFNIYNMNKKVYLAYFDILGFKNIVKNKSRKDFGKFINNVYVATQSALSEKRCDGVDQCTYITDMRESRVNCLHISDSILLWTNNDSCDDLHEIIMACRRLIVNKSVINHLLRGCLTYGYVEYDFFDIRQTHSTFLNYSIAGNAVVDAYEIAESLLMTGCAVTKPLYEQVLDCGKDQKYITNRNIQTKKGMKKLSMIAPFEKDVYVQLVDNTINSLQGAFKIPLKNKEDSLPKDVELKLNNTIDFYRSFLNPNKSCSK